MEPAELRTFLHQLRNSLNAASIHVFALRQDRVDEADPATFNGLEKSLLEARQLVTEFELLLEHGVAPHES